jgi:hypothetical protein
MATLLNRQKAFAKRWMANSVSVCERQLRVIVQALLFGAGSLTTSLTYADTLLIAKKIHQRDWVVRRYS